MSREIKISMGGKEAWRDNVFVERLWRATKYEEVYPQVYTSIWRYLSFYNGPRAHS